MFASRSVDSKEELWTKEGCSELNRLYCCHKVRQNHPFDKQLMLVNLVSDIKVPACDDLSWSSNPAVCPCICHADS